MPSTEARPPFDPARLGDDVATRTDWGPCKSGGSNFCTHVLVGPDGDRARFRPTLGALLFGALFFSGGVLLAVAPIAGNHGYPWFILLVAAAFGGPGAWMLWSFSTPRVFDRALGAFYVGWSAPSAAGTGTSVPLGEVHALQLVSEYCGGKDRFWSYELNLVLKDGRRVNVIDHGDVARVRKDAAALAQFLAVPFWDPS